MRTGAGRLLAGDGGAVAVEAALLVPVFLLLVLGVVESSLYMRDTLSVTESARVGARTASAMPRQSDFTRSTVEAIGRAGTAMPMSNIGQVLIYRANAQGFPGPDRSTTMSCSVAPGSCDRYVWDSGSSSFVLTSGSVWDPVAGAGQAGNVNACPAGQGGPPDSAGVYVEAVHPWVTGLFGSSHTLRARAVLPFEPMRPAPCQ